MSTTEHEPTREDLEARFLATYQAWYDGEGDGRSARAAFVSAAFNLGRVMYEESISDE